MNNGQDDLVEWQPELSPEAQEYLAELRADVEPKVALVRKVRKALGLSQVEVAEILKVTQSNVSKIEAKDDPTLSALGRMVAARGGKLRIEIETADGDELRFAVAGGR